MQSISGISNVPITDLEALYDVHHRRAIGVAYQMLGNLADAEETVQEAFLSVWRAGHTYDSERGGVEAWIVSVVRHRCIDVLRARRRRPVEQLDLTLQWPDQADPAADALQTLARDETRCALAGLPADQRETLDLVYFQGLTHREIALRLDLPLGTVKGRIRLALDRLRLNLDLRVVSDVSATAHSRSVLVVDDDPSVRTLIVRVLEEDGLSVIHAQDGREALQQARMQTPALVVLDLLLPHLNGDKVASALRSSSDSADTPILLISVDRALQQKAAQLGAYAYLEKPFELDDLLAAVRSGLANRHCRTGDSPRTSPG